MASADWALPVQLCCPQTDGIAGLENENNQEVANIGKRSSWLPLAVDLVFQPVLQSVPRSKAPISVLQTSSETTEIWLGLLGSMTNG